jgi:hypothetical protein
VNDDADERLLADLADLFARADPEPEHLRSAARFSFALRRLDAELAELLHDSALEAPAGVRSAGGLRALVFGAPGGTTVDVEVQEEESGLRTLIGQIVPARAMAVRVRHEAGVIVMTTDELGRFRAEGVRRGPVSIRCEPPGDPAVETGWVTV